ncbi:MAG: RpiB/LacA/LacB family sugar-phosphate isomerase, partial [Enhydrobacter sp.]
MIGEMAGATIAVASDHAGFDLKELLKRDLQEAGYAVLDLGTNSTASVDYPDFGKAMGDAIASGRAEKGVLVCGSGIGVSIAANRN